MTERTNLSTVTFKHPFHLPSVGRGLAAGDYDIETDEELIGDFTFQAYRRVGCRIIVPHTVGTLSLRQAMVVEPHELDAALAADRDAR